MNITRTGEGFIKDTTATRSVAAAIIGAVEGSDCWQGIDQLTAIAKTVARVDLTASDVAEIVDALTAEGLVGRAAGNVEAPVGKVGHCRFSCPSNCVGVMIRRPQPGDRWESYLTEMGGRRAWHSHAPAHMASDPASALAVMYHTNEVTTIIDRDDYVLAFIEVGRSCDPSPTTPSPTTTSDDQVSAFGVAGDLVGVHDAGDQDDDDYDAEAFDPPTWCDLATAIVATCSPQLAWQLCDNLVAAEEFTMLDSASCEAADMLATALTRLLGDSRDDARDDARRGATACQATPSQPCQAADDNMGALLADSLAAIVSLLTDVRDRVVRM